MCSVRAGTHYKLFFSGLFDSLSRVCLYEVIQPDKPARVAPFNSTVGVLSYFLV